MTTSAPKGPQEQRSPRLEGRRRRPSGEPSPLPRETLAGAGKVWLASIAALGLILLALMTRSTYFFASGAWWDELDQDILGWVVSLRTDIATGIARFLAALTDDAFLSILRWGTILLLLAVKRWRHLAVFVAVVLGTEVLAAGLTWRMARVRPDGIQILTEWSGFSFPSIPYVAFTVTLISIIYATAPPGRARSLSLRVASVLIVVVGMARVYLGVDRVTDGLGGGIIAVAIPVLVFRLVVPDAVYPVSYSRSKTAHLDLTGPRRDAIFRALSEQLGIHAVDIELFGAEGSGGSTPLRVALAEGGHVFAKIYAQNHLRSDRWYKLGRSLLYGALEDEAPYRTVRRLAEHEDHMMRLMLQAGVPLPQPLGIVEITAGREYLMVTEFIEGATEIGEAELDETVVRTALEAVRAMWAAGLAHRDIKPANILVADSRIHLIDHAFGEIRATGWREAADLANMILTLSLRYPAAEVHRIASEIFTAADIGEAFAVARGVTIPGELRSAMKATGTDLLEENRALAPHQPPIGIQRWTPRRVWALTVAAMVVILIGRIVILNREIASTLL